MNPQLVQTVLGALLLVTSLAAFVAGIVYVRWDTGRRGLPEWQRLFWTALAFWPLFGFTVYVIAAARAAAAGSRRAAGGLRLSPGEGLPPRQRVTLPRPPVAARRRPATQPAGDDGAVRHPDYIPTAPVSAVRPAPAGGSVQGGGVQSPAPPAGRGVQLNAPTTNAATTAPTGAPAVYALTALEGPHAGQRFELRELPARVGRGAEVAIRLDADLGVSRRHAELYEQAGVLRLRDTHSAHGTTVNGYTITDKGLAPGDRIRVGHSLLQLQHAERNGGGKA
jgi:hypothetical protein